MIYCFSDLSFPPLFHRLDITMIFLTSLYMFYLCIQIIASENSHNEVQLKHHSEEKKDSNFDIFIFTLHWPYTTCYDWKESGKNHKCRDIGRFKKFELFWTLKIEFIYFFRQSQPLECSRVVAHQISSDCPHLL